jgi:hypothetical protein
MEQEVRAKVERLQKILDNRKEYLERPEIGYYLLVKNIKSEKNKRPFFLKMHERTRLCHPVFHQKKKEDGYRQTVKELLKYFQEKHEKYSAVLDVYERRRNSEEMRIKQQQFKKEADAMREFLLRKEIEKELSQINFSKLSEAYKDLTQIDFTAKPIYADLLDIEKLAVL